MKERIMTDRKLQLGLLIGATVLTMIIIMICAFTGVIDVGGSTIPASENQVVIEEISEDSIKGYYMTESGRKKEVTIPIADTVMVEDVNGQEIGRDELATEDTIQVSMGEDEAAQSILLLPDESRDFC